MNTKFSSSKHSDERRNDRGREREKNMRSRNFGVTALQIDGHRHLFVASANIDS